MRVGKVAYVDIVADAGAVVAGVIVAENFNCLAAAQGYVEDQGYQVRFGLVGFASGDDSASLAAGFGSAGYVEVAERGRAQAMNAMEPAEHVFDEQFGLAIGVGGAQFGGFGDGDGFGFSVNGRCGAENKSPGPGGEDGFEQRESGGGVIAEVDFRLLHGFAGFDERCEVENTVKGNLFISGPTEEAFDLRTISNIGFNEFNALGNEVAAGVAEIVNYGDLMPSLDQQFRNGTTDITGTARDHNLHKKITPQTAF